MNINLLPPESVAERYSFSVYILIIGALLIGIIAFASLGLVNQRAYGGSQHALISLNMASSALQSNEKMLQMQIPSRISSQPPNASSQLDWKGVIASLQGQAVGVVSIQLVTFKSLQITAAGIGNSVGDVASFQTRVALLPEVSSAWVSSVQEMGAKRFQFMMSVTLRGENR